MKSIYTNEQLAEKFEEVANKLEEVKSCWHDGLVVMDNAAHPSCGTPACHGGWIAVAYGLDPGLNKNCFYVQGKYKLAEILGFKSIPDLLDWATNNPKMWGNDWGDYMFHSGIAFNTTDYTFNLDVIINHYRKVAHNLRTIKEVK